MRYFLVNDESGEEVELVLSQRDAEESRAFWKSLGWTLFQCTP